MTLTADMFPCGAPYTFTPTDVAYVQQGLMTALGKQYLQSEQVGSSYIVGEGSDLDIVVRVRDIDDAALMLDEAGYTCNCKGTALMARSTYIYTASTAEPDSETRGTFTVKHELVRWLSSLPRQELEALYIERHRDGRPDIRTMQEPAAEWLEKEQA